ncbi:MAG: recombinase family protein [Clostridium sp.]|nr:recombinase family protein [Clostridium sp.]
MKVAIYPRLSEEDRDKKNETDESESIQNQKSMLIEYAINQGWEIYDIYTDEDYTGADRNRPEFNRLLKDAEARKFDIVLCKTQSRFTRELELVEKYIHGLFPQWGIRFVSIVDHADTNVKGNKKARQINGLINEWYLEDLSENIKSVFNNKRQNGVHIGAFALYGYQKDPNQKGHLIIDEEAAQVVREVFTLFAQGYGKTNIARILNDRGIPNPTEYKRQKGLRYKQASSKSSTLWKYFAISNMLTNEIYIGNMVQGKYGSISYKTKKNKPRPKEEWYVVENTHEPIIDRDLWDRVQALIKEKSKPFSNGQIGLFARKTRCMYCGYTMRSTKQTSGQRYLQCPTRHVSKEACQGSMISVDVLERVVLKELKELSAKYIDNDYIAENTEFNNRINEQIEVKEKSISDYQQKSNECSEGIKNLYIDKVKGLITEDIFIDLTKNLHADKNHAEEMILTLSEQIEELRQKLNTSQSKQERIKQYTNVEKLTREIVDTMIDYIEIGKRIPGTRERPINIYWNF